MMLLPTTRRRLLQAIAVSAAAAIVPLPLRSMARAGNPARGFPQSIASGDPRPDQVLLWTRVEADAGDVPVWLELGTDPELQQPLLRRELLARADADHCLKVRVSDLQPATTYYYRFLVEGETGWVGTVIGRTRTAPSPDDGRPLRFAVMSCQDFGGRWYNSLLPLLDEDLDFVLHLGDFIYETAGDPGFQSDQDGRRLRFDDLDGALRLGSEARPFFAARSLSNYRQLHRTVRGDPVLQRLLERAPLVAIWDDHEFADDSWQDCATHFNGRRDERDRERRRNAEQAYVEYMPVDFPGLDEALPPPRESLHPRLRLWRELRFGKQLHLFLTDYRSHRPDHPIPEDAFPGEVVFDEVALRQRLPLLDLEWAAVAPLLLPYVDLAAPGRRRLRARLRRALRRGYREQGLAPADANARARRATDGRMALPVAESLAARWNAAVPSWLSLPGAGQWPSDGLGLAWLCLGKTQLFDSLGSRYFVVKEAYDLLDRLRGLDGHGSAFGQEQSSWLRERLQASDARWKAVASSVSFSSLTLDLADPELDAPPAYRRRFYLNVDHWDGFPAERADWIAACEAAGGALLFSGDIHAGLACQHAKRTVEFTVPAVSSETLSGIVARSVEANPANRESGRRMVAAMDRLFRQGNASLRHAQSTAHGCLLVEIEGERLQASFLELPARLVAERHYERPQELQAQVFRRRFELDLGEGEAQLRDVG